MLKTKTEILEEKLAAGGILIGTQCDIPNYRVLDMTTTSPFDTIWIDTEHHPIDKDQLNLMLMILSFKQHASIVRVVNNDPSTVKPILDMGPDGIIFPNVKSVEEAELCVASATYPPEGIRGYAPGRGAMRYGLVESNEEYIEHNAKKIWKIIQLEDYHVQDCIEDMVKVKGIDCFFIGPWDMSGSMGVLNQTDHPDLKKVFDRITSVINAAGIPYGVACMPHQVPEWLARGCKWLNLGADLGFVAIGAAEMYKSISGMVDTFKEGK